ncbi:MAG: PepSY-like domain-containing protein [Prevotella sp.]|nr:PepSY-like domain-containing protein [Bacteroides sp.]MCM1367107.1 PepSY-like domain-containing protein [Prevotella sp.]MCM1437431.1 PepSY-like domain-containing protein [Prevotella sp.]
MKKTFRILGIGFIAAVALTFASCSDDEDYPVPANKLPIAAQNFINNYYSGVKISTVEVDKEDGKTEFDVTLANGHEVTFTPEGEWTDVDAPYGQTVPDSFVLPAILDYIRVTYPGQGVNEISRQSYGYEVELTNGIELKFNSIGEYLGLYAPEETNNLPGVAQDFLQKYFSSVSIVSVEVDKEDGNYEYEALLSDGIKVTFTRSGEWIDVDAPQGKSIPDAFILPAIHDYIFDNYPNQAVNEISKERYGFEVELTNGIELCFNTLGEFIGVDSPNSSVELPQSAIKFLNDYYPTANVISVKAERENGKIEYEALLANGHSITFNESGEWIELDAPYGDSVPTAFLNNNIQNYLADNYSGYGVKEISRNSSGYEIELSSGIELIFDVNGNFVRIDR